MESETSETQNTLYDFIYTKFPGTGKDRQKLDLGTEKRKNGGLSANTGFLLG